MAPVLKLLESLPHTWRGVLAVISILLAGLTTGWGANALFGQASELPARVDALEIEVRRHTVEIESIRGNAVQLEKKVDRVLCYAESQAGVRPVSDCVR